MNSTGHAILMVKGLGMELYSTRSGFDSCEYRTNMYIKEMSEDLKKKTKKMNSSIRMRVQGGEADTMQISYSNCTKHFCLNSNLKKERRACLKGPEDKKDPTYSRTACPVN